MDLVVIIIVVVIYVVALVSSIMVSNFSAKEVDVNKGPNVLWLPVFLLLIIAAASSIAQLVLAIVSPFTQNLSFEGLFVASFFLVLSIVYAYHHPRTVMLNYLIESLSNEKEAPDKLREKISVLEKRNDYLSRRLSELDKTFVPQGVQETWYTCPDCGQLIKRGEVCDCKSAHH